MKTTLILGSTVIDMIVQVPHLPVTQEDINTRSMTMALGGCSYNAARMLRLFQLPLFHCSPTGDGVFGQLTEKLLREEGLSPAVRVKGQDNGCCLCLVEDSGERTFLSTHGAEYGFCEEWLADLDPAQLDYVYVCGIELEEPSGQAMLKWLRDHPGPQVFFAPGARLMHLDAFHWQQMEACRPILHLNEAEACWLSKTGEIEEAARTLHDRFGQAVIITRGEQGAVCCSAEGNVQELPGVAAEVVDTIGAGDCHAGTVLAGLKLGWPLAMAVDLANAMAARVVARSSARLDETEFDAVLNTWRKNAGKDLPAEGKCGIL